MGGQSIISPKTVFKSNTNQFSEKKTSTPNNVGNGKSRFS